MNKSYRLFHSLKQRLHHISNYYSLAWYIPYIIHFEGSSAFRNISNQTHRYISWWAYWLDNQWNTQCTKLINLLITYTQNFLIYPYGVMNEKIPVIALLQKDSRRVKKACTGTALSWKDTWSLNKDDTNHQSEIQQTV